MEEQAGKSNKKILSPINDYVFKKIFKSNKYFLISFLCAVLALSENEIQDVQIFDPYLDPNSSEEKKSILDIKLRTRSGSVINIEVQVKNQDFIWKRIQYYHSRLHSEQGKVGIEYKDLPHVITILVADFSMIDDEIPHHSFRFFDEKNKVRFQDSTQIDILELSKAEKMEPSALSFWLDFLSGQNEEDFEMAAQASPVIAEAWEFLKRLSADENVRAHAAAREKEIMDRNSELGSAERRGEARGEARAQEKIARNLLRQNFPLDAIAAATGLSLKKLEKLASELSAD